MTLGWYEAIAPISHPQEYMQLHIDEILDLNVTDATLQRSTPHVCPERNVNRALEGVVPRSLTTKLQMLGENIN